MILFSGISLVRLRERMIGKTNIPTSGMIET